MEWEKLLLSQTWRLVPRIGKKVLVIDCDYQANVTSLCLGDALTKQKDKSFTHAIKFDLPLDDVVVGTPVKNVGSGAL